MLPKISIIIPAYNSEKFLGRCLRSIINQTIPSIEYEIILVDDGSNDKTNFIAEIFGKKDHPVATIGTRHGEKLFEVLLSREERIRADDLGNYYQVPYDGRDLNYKKYFDHGELSITEAVEYSSHNTERLDLNATKELLGKLDLIKKYI